MNNHDWKIGDKVYYFWHANDCALIWDLSDFELMEDEIIGFNQYLRPMITGHYDFNSSDAFYPTKQAAIDSMIEHLKEEL